jgi:hypothetical protein
MRPLSATEAITPAIDRAKAILRPFSLGLWMKLGLVALLAELTGQFLAPPMGGGVPHSSAQTPAIPSGIGAVAGAITLAVIVVVGLVFFVLGLLLLYFGSRMQLVLMDLVATRTNLVAPAWHRTAPRTWRWIGLKVLSFLAIMLLLGILLAAPIIYFIRSMPKGGGQPPSAAIFANLALFIMIMIVVVIILMVALWLLRDFVLPFLLFDDADIGTALRDATEVIRREPGSVLFYLFMKLVITIIAGIAAELLIALALFVAAIPLGIVGGVLWFSLRHAGSLAVAIMYISFGLLAVVFVAAAIILLVCIGGAVLIFYQSYALYFLAGRYPRLGALLEPPPPFEQHPPLPNIPPPASAF